MRLVKHILGFLVLCFVHQAAFSGPIPVEENKTQTTNLAISIKDTQRVSEDVFLDESILKAAFFHTTEASIKIINSSNYTIRYIDLDLPEIHVKAGDEFTIFCHAGSVNMQISVLAYGDETLLSHQAKCGDILHVQLMGDAK